MIKLSVSYHGIKKIQFHEVWIIDNYGRAIPCNRDRTAYGID